MNLKIYDLGYGYIKKTLMHQLRITGYFFGVTQINNSISLLIEAARSVYCACI